uniref:Uncharacterized protein n=1 Tax=Rhizophora mucronata TaxID=61149 RepID=A0A2P2KAE9_RHIMU
MQLIKQNTKREQGCVPNL